MIKGIIPWPQNDVWNVRSTCYLYYINKNSNASPRMNKKYIRDNFTWNYYNNDFQSPLIVMVNICHCYSCTISWYSGKFKWFNKKYITLWIRPRYYSSWEKMMTQSTIIIETKKPTTTKTSFYLIYRHYYSPYRSGSNNDCFMYTFKIMRIYYVLFVC